MCFGIPRFELADPAAEENDDDGSHIGGQLCGACGVREQADSCSDSSATGAPISSSMRRMYLIAGAGRSAQERAPLVDSCQPGKLS